MKEKSQLALKIYAFEVFIDIAETMAMEVEHEARKEGVYVHTEKKEINKIKRLVTALAKRQRKLIGDDNVAEKFGDHSDYVKELLE